VRITIGGLDLVLPRILYIGAWSFTLARQFCVDIVCAPDKMFLAMKNLSLPVTILLAATLIFLQTASAQLSTPPATYAEKEAVYTLAIEGRTADILKTLNLTDSAKSNTVHDVIIAQYRALRTRDAAIDANYDRQDGALDHFG
jgi:hypothetical protein